MSMIGWRERVSPWDTWVACAVMSGLALWLIIDRDQYPTMALWVRLCIAAVLVVIGLWFAIVETVDAVRRNRS